MSGILTKFDRDKAIEVILYIASRLRDIGQEAGFHKIAKICYFADRNHLSDYGRLIAGDQYVAMRNGPVPSGTYDLMKKNSFTGCDVATRKAFNVAQGYVIEPIRDAKLNQLSDSERTSLDAAIEKYGAMSFRKLTRKSHDSAWDKADLNNTMNLLDIVETLPNGDDLKNYLLS